jgi:hypothetical protein
MSELILIAIGIAWLRVGYVAGVRRIRLASAAQLRVMSRFPPWVTVLTFAVTTIIWPFVDELA